MPAETPPMSVLCVCTGNVCRSPAAERLLAAALGPTVDVSSAGTYALAGEPISPPMDELIAATGADPTGFAARWVDERLLRRAGLVLALTLEHRSAAVELAPAVVRRAFTLKEFARLSAEVDTDRLPDGDPADRLRALIPLAASRRQQVVSGADDVPDPYRQGDAAYRQAFDEIQRAVDAIAAVVVTRAS